MLINRLLRDNDYIFIQNVDPLYIKMIIDIGSYPIFIYTHRSHKSIYIGSKLDDYSFLIGEECCNLIYNSHNYPLFNFGVCTVSDIKYVLKMSMAFTLSKLPIMYFN